MKKIDIKPKHLFMPNKESDITKEHAEEFYRFSIIESYILTDIYISHKQNAQNKLDKINKEIQSKQTFIGEGESLTLSKIKEKYLGKALGIVAVLNNNTGIPHHTAIDEIKLEFLIKEPEYKFDYLPLELTSNVKNPPGMMTLRFDLNRGFEEQLKSAKTKLKKGREQYYISKGKASPTDIAFSDKSLSTSRQSIQMVSDAIKFVAHCDYHKRENNTSRKQIAKESKMNYDTANKKYKTGSDLIISRDISRFFPEFN